MIIYVIKRFLILCHAVTGGNYSMKYVMSELAKNAKI